MRIRKANRIVASCALAVLAMTVSIGQFSPASHAALAPHSLMAGDFQLVTAPGFGDTNNSWAWSMQVFHDKLYVGTNRDMRCVQAAAAHFLSPGQPYPPNAPYLVNPCQTPVQSMPLGARIYSLDLSTINAVTGITTSNWQQVYVSPNTVPYTYTNGTTTTVFQTPRDLGFRGMTVFSDALFVSGIGLSSISGNSVPPPSLLYSTDGANFVAAPADPGTLLGSINNNWMIPYGCCMRGAASFNGALYIIIGNLNGDGAVYYSTTPTQGDNTFKRLTPLYTQVYELQSFNGHLYLGIQSPSGYSVWQAPDNPSVCDPTIGCSQSQFKVVIPSGAGITNSAINSVTSMHVYTDTNNVPHLYIGTAANGTTPVEITRLNTDGTWDLVVGHARKVTGLGQCNCVKYPTSGLDAGFGWPFNHHMWRMEDYNGVLYVGTYNEATFYKGTTLGNELEPMMGFQLWASDDGLTFMPVTLNGFGQDLAFGVRSLKATPNGLFLGSANSAQGLGVWAGDVHSSALALAPKNVQSDTATTPGAVALIWDASPAATLYHVYRSTAVRQNVPSVTVPVGADESGQASTLPAVPNTWIPGAYSEIGTTANTAFVDNSTQPNQHYSYYVVAQDAAGDLSAPSNVISDPSQGQLLLPTFSNLSGLVTYFVGHGSLTFSQGTAIGQALVQAHARLSAGDAQGCNAILETLRQSIMSRAHTAAGHATAETFSFELKRLEQRVHLVKSGMVSASQLG